MPPSFLGEVGGNEGEITRNVRRSDGRDYSRRMGDWGAYGVCTRASSRPPPPPSSSLRGLSGGENASRGRGRQVSPRLTMFPLRNFDLGTETERARLKSETGRLTAPDNEQRGFRSLESDFRIKEIKERRAVPATRRETAARHSFRTQTAENDEASHMALFTRCRNTKGVTNGGT